ncbi:MAG: hypothetical protein LUH22_15470 [Bacteroides sp.]|nr:hypothetical protein [Bacteroides sp.]
MKKLPVLSFLLLSAIVVFTGCNKDDEAPEVIEPSGSVPDAIQSKTLTFE